MSGSAELLLWGIIAHLVADWPLQIEWMAINKTNWKHPAAWAHAGVHGIFMVFIFPWHLGLLLAISHLWIDTRTPVFWWMRVIKRMDRDDPRTAMVETWLDQVFHIMMIALVVLLFY